MPNSRKLYNLLREKNRLEKKRDEITSEFFQTIVNWSWGGQDRVNMLNKYNKAINRVVENDVDIDDYNGPSCSSVIM